MFTKETPVEIKGQKEGLWIYLHDQTPVEELFIALDKRLESSNNFFSGAEVTIAIGQRVFSEEDQEQLHHLVEQKYTLHIKELTQTELQEIIEEEDPQEKNHSSSLNSVNVPDNNDETKTIHADSLLVREAEVNERSEGEGDSTSPVEEIATETDTDDEFMKFLDETFRIPVRHSRKQPQTYSSEHLYEHEERAFYFRGTVRSGQSLEFPGNVVILGDVNPGAYIVASGDIIVLGRLNGVVHAGAEGEERAVVIGASFNPSQLRIAQYIGRPPDEPSNSNHDRPQTEKAYIKDGMIVIEPIL